MALSSTRLEEGSIRDRKLIGKQKIAGRNVNGKEGSILEHQE